jgi:hypothetical protein
MRGLGFLLLIVLSAAPSAAQQLTYDLASTPTPESAAPVLLREADGESAPGAATTAASTSTTNDFDMPLVPLLDLRFTGDITTRSSDELVLKDTISFSGPVVRPFKARNVLDIPLKLLELINPFAKGAPAAYERRVEPMEARAWATIVGWHPGMSASCCGQKPTSPMDRKFHPTQIEEIDVRVRITYRPVGRG